MDTKITINFKDASSIVSFHKPFLTKILFDYEKKDSQSLLAMQAFLLALNSIIGGKNGLLEQTGNAITQLANESIKTEKLISEINSINKDLQEQLTKANEVSSK